MSRASQKFDEHIAYTNWCPYAVCPKLGQPEVLWADRKRKTVEKNYGIIDFPFVRRAKVAP